MAAGLVEGGEQDGDQDGDERDDDEQFDERESNLRLAVAVPHAADVDFGGNDKEALEE